MKFKMINYLSDYGPTNFWQNITKDKIEKDLEFIANNNINSIILMYPYATFKPKIESFETPYSDLLHFIIKLANEYNIKVILRFGYLWESNFMENRTYERYRKMYKSFKNKTKCEYLDDFVNFFNYTINEYNILHTFISWEDFFWPVHYEYTLENGINKQTNQEVELENKELIEYILKKIGHNEKLFIEQRTNGFFNKINYTNNEISYSYYNTFSLGINWFNQIAEERENKNHCINRNMIVEKNFIEWYSRVVELLDINEKTDNKLIIDQFNIIDNTWDEDDYHKLKENDMRKKCFADNNNFKSILNFISVIAPKLLGGIGIWCMWDTIIGHAYNGTFKHDECGWDTNAYFNRQDKYFKFEKNNYIKTCFGYVREREDKKMNILIDIKTNQETELVVKYNNEKHNISVNKNEKLILPFSGNSDRNFELKLLSGEIEVHRIDIFGMKLKSFMYDENKIPKKNLNSTMKLINSFD